MLSKIVSLLKLAGVAGLIGLLSVLFHEDDGCWQSKDGVKSLKINDFDFSGDNKKYCACSSTSDFNTLTPTSQWCQSGVSKGNPTYVTCEPYSYPACSYNPNSTSAEGIYYGYYISSPLGVLNSLVGKGEQVAKDAFSGIKDVVKYAIPLFCFLLLLFLVYKGSSNFNVAYLILGVIVIAIGIAGYLFF